MNRDELIASLRAKIKACVDGDKKRDDETEEGRHAALDAGLDLDDFVSEWGEELVEALSPEVIAHWRDPKDKPAHLPGEHHSQSVLLLMKAHGWIDEERYKIGHVSLGHWRPSGGNGNFDDDVEGWMPLPSCPPQSHQE